MQENLVKSEELEQEAREAGIPVDDLPKMEGGTEKQVSYAKILRLKLLIAIKKEIAKCQDPETSRSATRQWVKRLKASSPEEAIAKIEEFLNVVMQCSRPLVFLGHSKIVNSGNNSREINLEIENNIKDEAKWIASFGDFREVEEFPPLEGSEAQIEWALKLRDRAYQKGQLMDWSQASAQYWITRCK